MRRRGCAGGVCAVGGGGGPGSRPLPCLVQRCQPGLPQNLAAAAAPTLLPALQAWVDNLPSLKLRRRCHLVWESGHPQ